MHVARAILGRPFLAAFILACVLALRLVVPTGYMLDGASGLSMTICPGVTGEAVAMSDMMPLMHAMNHPSDHDHGNHQNQGTCPFAAISTAALCVLFVAYLLASVVKRGATPSIRSTYARWAETERLRPPLRGPPLNRA